MKIAPVVILAALSISASAAVPSRITYQGRLSKSGVSVAGPHDFQACLKVSSGPQPPCQPFKPTLPPSGDFTLLIDVPPSVDWLANSVKVELTIDGHLLSPPDDFTAVPYALVASTAAAAQGLIGPLAASQVQLTGASSSLNAWQSASSPDKIDAGKIEGPFPNSLSVQSGIVMNNTKISGLAPATNANEAARLDQVQSVALPPGGILPFAGSILPSGFLLCDGSAVSRTTYAALFAAVGITWGAGDGSTTFNLPNLVRRVLVGSGGAGSPVLGNNLGNMGGEESHLLTISEIPSHSHGVNDPGHTHLCPLPLGGPGAAGGGQVQFPIQATGSAFTGITIQNAGGGGAHNNMQPSAVVNYIIKY